MSGIVIRNAEDRALLKRIIDDVRIGTEVRMGPPQRTNPQNAKMWVMLGEVAKQYEHNGRYYSDKVWKLLFLQAWGKEVEIIPTLDGEGVIPYDGHSSEMEIDKMSEFIEFIIAWGVQNGVVFKEPVE